MSKKFTFLFDVRDYFYQNTWLIVIISIFILLKDELNVIDSLTGMPVADDELLFCFAMCAPYTAIQNYKFIHI